MTTKNEDDSKWKYPSEFSIVAFLNSASLIINTSDIDIIDTFQAIYKGIVLLEKWIDLIVFGAEYETNWFHTIMNFVL